MKNLINIKLEKARRLEAARKAKNLNRTEAARLHRWNYNTYKSHESGQREFDATDASRYSVAFGVPINHLLCLDLLTHTNGGHSPDSSTSTNHQNNNELQVFTVPVFGQAAGGLWLEGEDMPYEEPDLVPAVAGYPVAHQYARKVVGNSVSNRIADGEYAIFVRLEYYGGGPRYGQLVDCQRSRAGLHEHTVKVFRGSSLETDSRDLEKQTAIPLADREGDTLVEIVGVAVGAYRPLS